MEKLTQSKIAEKVGVTDAFISQIFNGLRKPSWSVAIRLGQLFNVEAAFWMDATPKQIKKLITRRNNG